MWNNESRYLLFQNDSYHWVWCKTKEKYDINCLLPTVKQGSPSVMVYMKKGYEHHLRNESYTNRQGRGRGSCLIVFYKKKRNVRMFLNYNKYTH